MSTISKTRNSFERLVHRKGASVHWHREVGGVDCPCLTPEGFRDPEWHRLNPTAPVCNDDGKLVYVENVIPSDRTTNVNLNTVMNSLIATMNPGDITNYPLNITYALLCTYQLNPDATHSWGQAGAGAVSAYFSEEGHDQDSASAIVAALETATPVPAGTYTLISDAVINGRRCVLIASTNGLLIDLNNTDPITGAPTIVTTTEPDSLWSLEQPYNVFHGTIEDYYIKGFVQPAFISTRSRSNQLLMESFGEIQSDDHIGIFPIDYNSSHLDFADWSNSGVDWIEFNGMRFIAVAWNLLPAPDNANVSHHWEVALRRINEDLPNG